MISVALTVLFAGVSRAQTWQPTSGTVAWTTGTAWNGSIPNATGAFTVFPTGGVTVSIPATTVTTGTIRISNASGNVVFGAVDTTNDVLNLALASGSPVIDVAGGPVFMYANVTGSQGLTKTGTGNLSFRYNPHDMAYTGTVVINQGNLYINQDGSLGATSNPISITGNSALTMQNGSNSGTITLASGRATTISSGVTFTMQNGVLAMSTVANNAIGGSGSLKLVTGTFTLNAANTYTGATTLTEITKLVLGSGAAISTNSLTVATGATTTVGSTIDFGGNTQSVSSLSVTSGTQVTTTMQNGGLSVTGGNLSFNSGTSGGTTSGTSIIDMSQLSSFSYSNTSGTFSTSVNSLASSVTNLTTVKLAASGAGSNTITANEVKVGGGASNASANASSLGLGVSNTINTGTLTIGGYQGSGTASFQSGVANGSLTVRGVSGGASRADAMYVGLTNSGNRTGQGTMNLASGSIDARVTSLYVGFVNEGAGTVADTSTLTVSSGTIDATTIAIGYGVSSGNNAAITSTLTMNGGSVTAGSLVFGGTSTANTPKYVGTLNLGGGTLRAGSIRMGTGTFTSDSVRKIAWTSGTIATLDAATNLLIDGTNGSGGGLTIEVTGTGTKVFAPDTGRTITVGTLAVISNTGALAVNGLGTVVFNAANTYSGGTTISAGTLKAGNVNAFGSAGITLSSGATLDLNSLAVANAITNNGGTLSNAASYTGTQSLAASATFEALAGTLSVVNGGAATLGGAVTGTVSIAGGGGATLAAGGSLAQSGLTNNGTFTVNRNDNLSLATVISGSGGVVKLGSGTLTITSSNTYTGNTTVSAGRLAVNGVLGSGSLSVAAAAWLAGNGTIGGPVSVQGTLSPGNSPGLLTMQSLDLLASSTTAMEIAGTGRGTGYDAIDITSLSGLGLGGLLELNFTSTFPDNTTFDLFSFSGSPAGTFSSVTATGSYGSLTFVKQAGVWTAQSGTQTISFTEATGDVLVVPEPATAAIGGAVAVGLALWARRKRLLADL